MDDEVVIDHAFVPHHGRTFNNGVTVRYCAVCSRPEYRHAIPESESHQRSTY